MVRYGSRVSKRWLGNKLGSVLSASTGVQREGQDTGRGQACGGSGKIVESAASIALETAWGIISHRSQATAERVKVARKSEAVEVIVRIVLDTVAE